MIRLKARIAADVLIHRLTIARINTLFGVDKRTDQDRHIVYGKTCSADNPTNVIGPLHLHIALCLLHFLLKRLLLSAQVLPAFLHLL